MDLPEIILIEPEFEINVDQLSPTDYRCGVNGFSGLYKKASERSTYEHDFESIYVKQGTTAKIAIAWHKITNAWWPG